MKIEKMVGKLMSFHNGIHGEFFKEVAGELMKMEKIETAAKGFIAVTEVGGSCMGKQANYEALRAALNHKEG